MWEVARLDMYEGFTQLASMFTSQAQSVLDAQVGWHTRGTTQLSSMY